MTKAFNHLEQEYDTHSLTKTQKFTKFENTLKDENAIKCNIEAKAKLIDLCNLKKTLDNFFNLLLTKLLPIRPLWIVNLAPLILMLPMLLT